MQVAIRRLAINKLMLIDTQRTYNLKHNMSQANNRPKHTIEETHDILKWKKTRGLVQRTTL